VKFGDEIKLKDNQLEIIVIKIEDIGFRVTLTCPHESVPVGNDEAIKPWR